MRKKKKWKGNKSFGSHREGVLSLEREEKKKNWRERGLCVCNAFLKSATTFTYIYIYIRS